MIKKLSFKFLLVFLVLVVSIFITSSCYATLTSEKITSFDSFNFGITINDVYDYIETNELNLDSKYNLDKNFAIYDSSTGVLTFYFHTYEDLGYFLGSTAKFSYGDCYVFYAYSSSGVKYDSWSQLRIIYNVNSKSFFHESGATAGANNFRFPVENFTNKTMFFLDITSTDIYYKDNTNLIHSGNTYIQNNTSFNYFFEGVKRGKVKLTINDLDSSLKMFGYVGCENTLNVGDTLNTKSISDYLRLVALLPNNSDLYCNLYEGEELLYYIVNENYEILKIGYISEMAKGDFLYGFNVSNGVDFVFLRDGKVYWDNSLTFKYQLNNSTIHTYNDIVSQGNYSYIETDKTVVNGTYYGYVYDSSDNLLCSAESKFINNLSTSISISVDTSYSEDKTFLDEGIWTITSILLDGKDSSGNNIDFSNYSIRWSIPSDLDIVSITLQGVEYSKRSGYFSDISSYGSVYCNLSIRDYISPYKDKYVPFDITLQVYDDDDNLVLTHIINSDDIVSKKVQSEENNVDKGDYDILDNPNYTGGSSNKPNNFGNIQDWTVDDYTSLMSTDNFVWEFFKAILGNLPWWIEVPLTILIFGVVIITIIRFARGA